MVSCGLEIGNVLPERGDLFRLEFCDQVHLIHSYTCLRFRSAKVIAASELLVFIRVPTLRLKVSPPEIRSSFFRQPFGLVPLPVGDLRVMARQKNFGDRATVPDGGFGVLRVLQKSVRKAFLFDGRLIPEHARYKSDARIDQGLRGDLTAGEDKVAHRDLFDAEMVDSALVEPLKPTADKRHAWTRGQSLRALLRERAAPGRKVDQGASFGMRARASAIAFSITSARRTMPAPPPAGVSSTLRCLPSP